MTAIDGKKVLAAAIRRKQMLERSVLFDGAVAGSKPTEAQLSLLSDLGVVPVRYIRAANQSGKTQVACRECSWVFQENHPTWKRPARWGNETLQLMVACQTLKQFEDIIWKKLKDLLDPGCYRIKRNSTGIEKIINTVNGNEIIVFTYHNSGDAQAKLQGFVAHWVWVDEMPHSAGIFEELIRRVASRDGYFIATFTPKVRNDSIKRMVDSAQAPYAKVYRFRMFDNPLYSDPEKQAEERAKLAGLPASVIATILEGEWTSAESSVYYFNYDDMVRIPVDYSSSWRHLLSVDPAVSSRLGRVVFAEDPTTGHWYMMRADYVENVFIPTKIVEETEKATVGINTVRRVSDPNANWFIMQASAMGHVYEGVFSKTTRKEELMKNLQTALGTRLYIHPACTDFIEEVTGCQWSETTEGKIVKGQKYHLLDATQYGVDRFPAFEGIKFQGNWHQRLIEADNKRQRVEGVKQFIIEHGGRLTRRRRFW